MFKIYKFLTFIWFVAVFIAAVSVEIAWITFLFGSVLGVILMLIFFPSGFLIPFSFIMGLGGFSGLAVWSKIDEKEKEWQQTKLEEFKRLENKSKQKIIEATIVSNEINEAKPRTTKDVENDKTYDIDQRIQEINDALQGVEKTTNPADSEPKNVGLKFAYILIFAVVIVLIYVMNNNGTAMSSKNNYKEYHSSSSVASTDDRHSVYIDVEPQDAKIQIMNIKPKFYQGVRLEKGGYELKISKPGYETRNSYFILEEDSEYKVELKKIDIPTYKLWIKTLPDNATVKILNIKPKYHDGIKLQKGEYKIQISKAGYVTKNIIIDPSTQAVHSVTLEKLKDSAETTINTSQTQIDRSKCEAKGGEWEWNGEIDKWQCDNAVHKPQSESKYDLKMKIDEGNTKVYVRNILGGPLNAIEANTWEYEDGSEVHFRQGQVIGWADHGFLRQKPNEQGNSLKYAEDQNKQKIPENARRASDGNWECIPPYFRAGDKCKSIFNP